MNKMKNAKKFYKYEKSRSEQERLFYIRNTQLSLIIEIFKCSIIVDAAA